MRLLHNGGRKPSDKVHGKSREITFVLLFTSKICPQASQLHKLPGKSALPADRALRAICTYTILRPEQIPPVVPRQLADDIVRLLLTSKGQVRQGGSGK